MLCNINIVGGWGEEGKKEGNKRKQKEKQKEKGTVLDNYMYLDNIYSKFFSFNAFNMNFL